MKPVAREEYEHGDSPLLREETRMHVHVSHPDGEAKFWLVPHVELAKQTGLADHVVGEAKALVIDHLQEIVDAWNKHCGG